MTKTIDLNRKNISEDKIRNMLRKKGLGNLLLDDKTLLESRRSFVPDNKKANKDVWLFGYGSLIWNPVIEIEESRIAKVFGYHRKFCLKTQIGRGSEEKPGLVLGLENGGSTSGLALKVNSLDTASELDLVWRREMITGAYKPVKVFGHTKKGNIEMIVFVINKSHTNYIGKISEAETAYTISSARGFLGSGKDYLDKTVESLVKLGINDSYLSRLQNRIMRQNFKT